MRNISIQTWFILIVILLLTSSCIDQLGFIGETQQGQLVIYGLVTDGEDTHKVTVSRTRLTSYNPSGVPGAVVVLKNREGSINTFQSLGNGDFVLHGKVAEAGKDYMLEVQLDGNIYQSALEIMPTLSANDNLSYTIGMEPLNGPIDRPVMTTYSETTLPESNLPIYLRWRVEETYYWGLVWVIPESGLAPPMPPPCYISDILEPNRLNLFDGSFSNTRKTQMVMSKRLVDNSFIAPYNVSVIQLSTTRGAYEYWAQIKIMLENQGSLFDVPPATVQGNIYNISDPDEKVLGYFEIAKTKTTRLYTLYSDIPFYLLRPCDYVRGKSSDSYPSECHSCAARAGNNPWTSDRPDWWNPK